MNGAVRHLADLGMLAVSAAERARGLGRSFNRVGAAPWIILGVGLLIVAGVVTFFALTHKRDRQREIWRRFARRAARMGLGPEETALLRNVAIGAHTEDPLAVFTSEETFFRGMAGAGSGAGGVFGPTGAAACGSCHYYQTLREKLGFAFAGGPDGESAGVSLGPIAPGTTLKAVREHPRGNAEVILEAVSAQTGELTLAKRRDVPVHTGEIWSLQFAEEGILWEFPARVVAIPNETQLLARAMGDARQADRRRFVRVPVKRAAQVAAFPFSTADAEARAPEFIEARMVELAGPGVVLETELAADIDDRVLVVLEMADKRVEGIGVVRREGHGGAGSSIAIELIGLNTAQVAQLARETNVFATRNAWRGAESARAEPQEHPHG